LSEVTLAADGERCLREAEKLCWQTNVAILAPEHLLAGSLLVLHERGFTGLPPVDVIRAAVESAQGIAEKLDANVMWGSAARAALSMAVAEVRRTGALVVTAAAIAAGVSASGEVSPMFFAALGTTRDALAAAAAQAPLS
jgi:hypothetical protein